MKRFICITVIALLLLSIFSGNIFAAGGGFESIGKLMEKKYGPKFTYLYKRQPEEKKEFRTELPEGLGLALWFDSSTRSLQTSSPTAGSKGSPGHSGKNKKYTLKVRCPTLVAPSGCTTKKFPLLDDLTPI
jgi:hypothetical protein